MMTLLLVLIVLLYFLLLLSPASASNSSSSTLELTTGLNISPRSFPLLMSNVAIPAFQNAWFLPILSSPSFNYSNSSLSPGFSFGFFFNFSNVLFDPERGIYVEPVEPGIYLAVCGGLSGNFSNLTQEPAQLHGANDTTYLMLPSVSDGYAVPVSIANPFTSLRSYNASLVVVEVGGTKQLQLEDFDGRVVWNVSNVGLMEMHDTGTLVIYDTIHKTKVVWQNPPRDTLFRGEKLRAGMYLTSNDSSYSARLEKGGLVLYFNTLQFMGEQPAPYWAIPALLSIHDNPLNLNNKVMSSPCSGPINNTDTAYALLDEAFNLNIYPGDCSQFYDPLRVIPKQDYSPPFKAGPLSFVKLENDGWFRNYAVPLDLAALPKPASQLDLPKPSQLDLQKPSQLSKWSDYNLSQLGGGFSILQASLWDSCTVPYACGALGVCTSYVTGTPCTCPIDSSLIQVPSFHPNDNNDYFKGCTRITKLPDCTKDEHVHTTDFLQLDHTASIFLFSGWLFKSLQFSVETCKSICSSNCSCNGFFYQVNNSACFFITDEMTLLNLTVDYQSKDWPVDILKNNYVTYLKKVKVDQTSRPTGLHKSTVIAIAIASSFAACIGLGIALLLHSRVRRYRMLNKQVRQVEEELREVLPLLPSRFSYQDLHEATKGFSKLLGAGGCGSVYAGMLQDGRKVAVKTLEFSMKDHSKQFLAEVATIGRTSHHNIVCLVGFCWGVSSRLLVYEYMERGSLDHWLFHKPRNTRASICNDEGEARLLDWQTRYHMVLGIVRGLSYLHEECPQPILHFDIKPQNILLDGAFEAKLADFGMSRLMQSDVSEVVTGLRGTPGYIAPEWLLHGAVSKKGDIYSMGMVMLEVVGGRKNVDLGLLNNVSAGLEDGERHEPWHFPSWAARKCELGHEMELVDKRLHGAFNEAEARRLIYTAFWCIQKDPAMRPYAPTVLQWLEGSSPVKQPPFSSASHSSFSSTPSSSQV